MSNEQGTGKHPHKSAAEPYEHHEGKSTTSHASESKGASHTPATEHKTASKSEHSTQEGTGKHPHKKASDPKEHHEGAKK